MTKENEISPCPFCNGDSYLEMTVCDSVVRCLGCKGTMKGKAEDFRNVIAAWNRRTNPELSSLRAENEKLREALELVAHHFDISYTKSTKNYEVYAYKLDMYFEGDTPLEAIQAAKAALNRKRDL